MLSDNTVQGMSTMVKSSLDLISSGMKAVQATTVMGSNPQMAVGGIAAAGTGAVMLAGVGAQVGVGAAAGGGSGPGAGDLSMERLINSLSGTEETTTSTTSSSSQVGEPVDGGKILTNYGEATSFEGQRIPFHDGIDYVAKVGTPVRAVADGKVVKLVKGRPPHVKGADTGNTWGNYVKILHKSLKGKTQHTVYSHLQDVYVTDKQQVVKGEVIGTLGRSGKAAGPHLHFEYMLDGKATDPKKFKPNGDKADAPAPKNPGMDASALSQASTTAQALMGLFSGNMDQMTEGLKNLAKSLGIDASKYGIVGSNDGFGLAGGGGPGSERDASMSGNPVTNNTTINVNIPNATPDEAQRFAQLVAQYHDQNTLTSNMGRF
jgi:hypothetical protein